MMARRFVFSGIVFALLLGAAVVLLHPRPSASRRGPDASLKFPPHPDLLLITIDTLRADSLGFTGNRGVETPVLDRLAGQGLVFENAYAHNVVTLPSHANILTGLLPYQHGVRDNSGFRLDPGTETLASILKAKGFATAAFVGAFPLDSRFGLSRGFDVYDDRYPRGKPGLDFEMPERPAPEVISAARRWWEQSAGHPRFLWVHLYDCHAPYRPPPPFSEKYRDQPYLGEVAGVDSALLPLLEPFLSGQTASALIVMTSDHGEALGDHGEETHGLFVYEATLKVPLIVWFPGVLAPGRTRSLACHVDIAPTILQAAGIEKPAAWTGVSLFSSRSGTRTAYFEAYSAAYNRGWAPLRGLVGERFKWIDLPVPELYDLRSDPAEGRNLLPVERDLAAKLARQMPPDSLLSSRRRESPASEEVSRLRSLGYLSGDTAIKSRYTAKDDPKNLISIDRRLHDCVDRYQRGDLAGSIAVAREVVREQPAMSVGYENLGFLLRRRGATSEALDVYRKAVESRIATENLETQYALALCEAGRATRAVTLLSPLADSRNPETLNALGIAYSDAGHGREAAETFQRVLALDPRNVEAYENLGIVGLRAEDLARARDFFGQALAIDERLPRAWNGLGVVHARLGEDREAMRCWSRALTLDPSLYDALLNLGLTANKNGLRRDARQALERFVENAPRSQYGLDIEKARQLLRALGS